MKYFSMSLGFVDTRFSSSDIRSDSIDLGEIHTRGWRACALDAPLVCVLSKASATRGLGLVPVVF